MGRTRPSAKKEPEKIVCYCLENSVTLKAYTGISKNFAHRLRQHCREIAGGAKTTSNCRVGMWMPIFHVSGFEDWGAAMRFEKDMKRSSPAGGGRRGRVVQLRRVLKQWDDPRLQVELFVSREEYEELGK